MMRRYAICVAVCLMVTASAGAGWAQARSFDRKLSYALGHFIMGVLLDDLGDVDAALDEYARVLKADRSATGVRLHVAAGLIKKNDAEGAIRELDRITRIDPDAVEPHAVLALIYTSQNKLDLAAREYELALKNASKLDPENLDIYKSLGLVYLKQKKFKEAEQTYRLIIDLGGKSSESYYYLANAQYEQKNSSAAEQSLRTALELQPDNDEALNFLGYLFVEEDRNLAEAETLIRQALEINPSSGAYVDSLGWLYFKQNKLDDAVRELERASVLLDDATIYEHLGDAYRRMGNNERAFESWQKSLKLDPACETVKIKLKSLPKLLDARR